MQQSHAYNDTSLTLTTRILDAKARKDLSWQDLADDTGLDQPPTGLDARPQHGVGRAGHPQPGAVAQDVVEHGGLARAEEAREHRHRQADRQRVVAHGTTACPP